MLAFVLGLSMKTKLKGELKFSKEYKPYIVLCDGQLKEYNLKSSNDISQ